MINRLLFLYKEILHKALSKNATKKKIIFQQINV
jgi:hypothetical protein